jgi:hypothetical protein
MLDEFLGTVVVLELRSPFVCLGKLQKLTDHFLELTNADFHDLRDTQTTRENYVAASRLSGIKRNRKRIVILRSEVVAVASFDDVVAN